MEIRINRVLDILTFQIEIEKKQKELPNKLNFL